MVRRGANGELWSDLIEKCSPGPYLEMFARYPQPGWTVWGDEAAEDVVPKGQVHRGYQGGDIHVPQLSLFERLSDAEREEVAYTLRDQYTAGRSIREIANETGYSIQRVRSLLQEAETPLRGRGSPPQSEREGVEEPAGQSGK